MLLTPQEADLFFKLHRTLMFFVNQRLRVIPDDLAAPERFADLSPETAVNVRDALLDETDLIESFINENPAGFSETELDIVLSWRHLVAGKFYIFRYLKKHTIFLSSEDQPIAYGVTALTQPFEELVGPYLPRMTETVLLPFNGKIIYDGLLSGYNISFGGGIRRSLSESYQEAKKRLGIVTSLPVIEGKPVPKKQPPKKPTKRKSANPFQGRWRITWMEQWAQDVVDAEVEGYFEFDPRNSGSFQSCYVRGDIDYRLGTKDGKPCIEFTWEGNDEMDPVQGRGWAVIDDDELNGMIFIHHRDESEFRAKRIEGAKSPKRS